MTLAHWSRRDWSRICTPPGNHTSVCDRSRLCRIFRNLLVLHLYILEIYLHALPAQTCPDSLPTPLEYMRLTGAWHYCSVHHLWSTCSRTNKGVPSAFCLMTELSFLGPWSTGKMKMKCYPPEILSRAGPENRLSTLHYKLKSDSQQSSRSHTSNPARQLKSWHALCTDCSSTNNCLSFGIIVCE